MNSKQRSLALGMVLMFLVTHQAQAQQANDAYALMKKVCERSVFRDMSAELTLELTNKRGDQKVRKIKLWSKEDEKGDNRILMRFTSPADVRGVGFLLKEHSSGEDDRRLFLPALRRVQRISAAGKGGNFMSSDFTYYDIGAPKLADWTFSMGKKTEVQGVRCQMVTGSAAKPKTTEETGYSKIVWYVDPKKFIAIKADYYDKSGQLFKTMLVKKVETISGSPFATSILMEDLQSGHRSKMEFSDLKTDQGLADKIFTERNLRKWTR